MTKNGICRLLLLLLFSGICYCKEKLPYKIEAELIPLEISAVEKTGLDFDFYNLQDKEIKAFTLVFFIFDEEGNSVAKNKNNFVIKVEEPVNALDYVHETFSLDSQILNEENLNLQLDFVYVSLIEYSDGSIWKDPYGIKKW